MNREPHSVPGQLNVYVLDVDSVVTGYGAHNRLVVMGPALGSGERLIYIREDLRGLPNSTDAQRRAVANHPAERMHPHGKRLTHVSTSAPYDGRNGQSIDHVYAWN
jgi:hypothetical protein